MSGKRDAPRRRPRRSKPGQRWNLRPLRSGDEEELLRFFQSHTPETIYRRYGYHSAAMTRERAAELVGVDQNRDCALGVFEPAAEGEILHAVGRYCLDSTGKTAETAFVVRESMRQQGMATDLLREIVRTARERGLLKLWAMVGSSNQEMISLLRHHGFTFGPLGGNDAVQGTLNLGRPPG